MMTRTRITKLDMESPSEAAGEAFVTDGAGNVVISGIPAEGHTHLEVEITDILHNATQIQGRNVNAGAPATGQTYRWSGSEWIPSGVVATDEQVGEVQEEGTQKATDVSILNFKGTGVNQITDVGGGKVDIDLTASGSGATEFTGLTDTPSSYTGQGGKAVLVKATADGLEFGAGGGSALEVKDEGITIVLSGTSMDFVGNSVTATAAGTDVTVTVSGVVVSVPAFKGTRVYRASGIASPTTGSWTSVTWAPTGGLESYDTDNWFPGTDNTTIQVNQDGYYYIYGQISWEKSSVSGYLQTGIWKDTGAVLIADNIHGYAAAYNVPATTGAGTIYYLNTDDTIFMRHFISESATFPIASGIGKTYLEVHEIQPILQNSLARVYRSSDQSISTSTDTALSFNTEQYDTDGFWTSGTPTRITIPTDGYYHIDSIVAWEQNNVGYRRHWLRVDGGSTVIGEHQTIPAASSDSGSYVSTDYYFTANQYIEVYVWHNKGSNTFARGNIGRMYVDIHKIGT
jgi:hypothetical protein